jgi:hypothetical protein
MPPQSSPSQGANRGNTGSHTQSSLWRQQHSTKTDSTTHTYKENDTGYIKLNNEPEQDVGYDEPESQDASYEIQTAEPLFHGHPPETPAPPVNPFSHKGSVLKGHEMFGATQPSGGRNVETPTSTRPSPNIYDDFTSPARNRMLSSPLAQRNINHEEEEEEEEEEQTPPQSSIRNLLSQSMPIKTQQSAVSRTSGVQSFDTKTLQRTSSLPEPRIYKPMKESQERREKEAQAPLDSGSETDSDIEADPRSQRRQIERVIQKQFSPVRLPRMPPSRPRSSSARMETETPVPQASTGRRRSIQEEYIAQCDGLDARDTQQDTVIGEPDTVIADSQQAPQDNREGIETSSSLRDTSLVAEPGTGLLQDAAPNASPTATEKQPSVPNSQHDSERVPATETESAEQDMVVESSKDEPSRSLPLQEMSSNRADLRTPAASKTEVHPTRAEGPEEMVPESSPTHNHLRPMRDIGLSFEGEEEDDLLKNPPGFTQDEAFLDAIKDKPLDFPRGLGPRKESSDLSTAANPEPSVTTEETPAPAPEVGGQSSGDALQRTQPTNDPSQAHNTDKEQLVQEPAAADKNGIPKPPNEDRPEEVKALDETSGHSVKVFSTAPMAQEAIPDEANEKDADVSNNNDTLQEPNNTLDADSKELELPVAKRGLRTKTQLKGPSRGLRRSADSVVLEDNVTPHQSNHAPKSYSGKRSIVLELPGKSTATRSSKRSSSIKNSATATLRSTPRPADIGSASVASAKRSSRRQAAANQTTQNQQSPILVATKRNSKRKSGAISVEDDEHVAAPSRSSKRQSTSRVLREESEDPLALTSRVTTAVAKGKKAAQGVGLFGGMAFAVSYVKHEDKDIVIKAISDNGGQILADGFDCLFEVGTGSSTSEEAQLFATPAAKSVGFVALIADDHSRKTKYMQALALGLPCLSGRWVSACVAKGLLVDWPPYLLCAGSSSFLNNAHLSRTLEPYPVAEATLESTFAARCKMLEGKSILLVMGKGRADDKRKTFMFLTRALGPDRLGQAVDSTDARKKLLEAEAEGRDWDLLYVDSKEQAAQTAVFAASLASSGGSRKRKRGPTAADDSPAPPPKKIRVITDEVVVQSLIFGQLIEE